MESLTLTQNEVIAVGGILGGMLGGLVAFGIFFYILLIIANWKIFTKAGEAGWKSLIPIYNAYILCKIIGINFWIFVLGIPIALSILSVIFQNNEAMTSFVGIVNLIYVIFIEIYVAVRLGKAFNKSTLFILGLIFFPNIFQLILGFGASKYNKNAIEK